MDDFEAKIRLARAIHSGDNSSSFLVKNGFIFNFIEKKPIDSLLLENSIWFWLKNTFDHTHYRTYSTQYVVIASIDLIASFGCCCWFFVRFEYISGEMPYTCELCHRTFTFQQSYHRHLSYHTNDRPHSCSICGRAFKELSTLHNHQRIHSGEKPFECETCGSYSNAFSNPFHKCVTYCSVLFFSLSFILELDSICHIDVLLMPIYFFNSVIHSLLN